MEGLDLEGRPREEEPLLRARLPFRAEPLLSRVRYTGGHERENGLLLFAEVGDLHCADSTSAFLTFHKVQKVPKGGAMSLPRNRACTCHQRLTLQSDEAFRAEKAGESVQLLHFQTRLLCLRNSCTSQPFEASEDCTCAGTQWRPGMRSGWRPSCLSGKPYVA
jgi:hypothetical protein